MKVGCVQTYRQIFYAACTISFLLRIGWGIAISQLPIYVYELGASPIEVGLVFTVFAGLLMFSSPLWGYLSDYLGKRKPFIVLGMVALAPIFLLMSTQREIVSLIVLRGSTAIFVGAVVPATWALVSDISTHGEVGRKMGLLTSAEMAGFAIGPVLGGLIADNFSFPVLWLFVAFVCLAGGLTFLLFGSDPSGLRPRPLKRPSLDFSWRKSLPRSFTILFLGYSSFLSGVAVLGPNRNVYLVRDLGMSRTMAGLFDFVGILSLALLQPLAGSLSDKYGRRIIMVLASLGLIIGLINLYFAENFLQAVLSAALFAGYNSYRLAASAYISDRTEYGDRGGALGLFGSVDSATRSLGAMIGGLIIAAVGIRKVILLSTIFPALSVLITVLALKENETEHSTT
ncbi:MFS transporter [Candidatus Bathyarchaeota archaeon]|nr:MFS transporter [Candidatus Bathyarchaeota archaeon]